MKNILQFLEQQADQRPNHIALTDEHSSVTYEQFMLGAKAVGSALAELNIKHAPIAVLMERGLQSVIGFMGVVYSGNFYVVIDPKMPNDRIETIFNTLHPVAVVADEPNWDKAEQLASCEIKISFEQAQQYPIDTPVLEQIRAQSIDTDPLYALFTSGSTGVPKGAVICHRSVIAYAQWVTETFDITSETQFGNQTPFYFSMSVLDLFSSLKSGATLHIIPKQLFSFPIKLLEYLNQKQINTIYWVPSALCIIANWKALDYVPLTFLKKVLFAGEVMPTKQLNYWISKMPDLFYANLFGPTEVTDICTYYVVDRKFADDEPLPIGNACNNCDVLVLTEDGKQAEQGQEGELCVRGSFLALGYYNNPDKTAEVFVQNPLNPYYPELIYKTGDLVRYNEFGELMYLTRKDFQIKHMGYRIELGEIETAAGSVEQMKACACIYDSQKDAIVLIYQADRLKEDALMQILMQKLPKYMYPTKLIRVKQMPYNQNGKIDRVYLKQNYQTI